MLMVTLPSSPPLPPPSYHSQCSHVLSLLWLNIYTQTTLLFRIISAMKSILTGKQLSTHSKHRLAHIVRGWTFFFLWSWRIEIIMRFIDCISMTSNVRNWIERCYFAGLFVSGQQLNNGYELPATVRCYQQQTNMLYITIDLVTAIAGDWFAHIDVSPHSPCGDVFMEWTNFFFSFIGKMAEIAFIELLNIVSIFFLYIRMNGEWFWWMKLTYELICS